MTHYLALQVPGLGAVLVALPKHSFMGYPANAYAAASHCLTSASTSEGANEVFLASSVTGPSARACFEEHCGGGSDVWSAAPKGPGDGAGGRQHYFRRTNRLIPLHSLPLCVHSSDRTRWSPSSTKCRTSRLPM